MVDGRLGLPDDRWIEHALVFNFHPVAYIHDSWLGAVPYGDLIERLRGEPRAASHLSRFLREALGLEGKYCEDFSDRMARLALLDGDSIHSLFLYLGLALRNGELRTEIRGPEVSRLKDALGERAYVFAIRRAPFFGSLPDFQFEPGTGDPAERYARIGLQYCWGWLAGLGSGLVERLFLKLPRDWSRELVGQQSNRLPADAPVDMPPLLLRLVKETLPRWTPLFA